MLRFGMALLLLVRKIICTFFQDVWPTAKNLIHQEIEASHLLSNLEMEMSLKVCLSLFVTLKHLWFTGSSKKKYSCLESYQNVTMKPIIRLHFFYLFANCLNMFKDYKMLGFTSWRVLSDSLKTLSRAIPFSQHRKSCLRAIILRFFTLIHTTLRWYLALIWSVCLVSELCK